MSTTEYRVGDLVRTRTVISSDHIRIPGYVQGRAGRVTDVRGTFRCPEPLARGDRGGPREPVYAVEFTAAELWGSGTHMVTADICQHYLLRREDTQP
jgi:Nitrile hydratase beta subunit